jgi:acyl dehydratase
MVENIPAEAKAMIGRETVRVYDVTKKDIRRYAQAIDDPNPLYHDEEYAKKTKFGGIVAPPLFCFAFNFADEPVSNLRPDGAPSEQAVPLPVQRVMAGESSFDVGEPVRPGDVLTVRNKLVDIYKKVGKSGPLYFVVFETTYTNQKGQMAAREKATFVQR